MAKIDEFIADVTGIRKDAAMKATRERDVANTLLANPVFRDWAGDAIVANSFFGEGRELTP